VDNVWKIIYVFLGFALFIGIITHGRGFATVAGSIFSGTNSLGQTLIAGNVPYGT
jgi:hypothetical protein